MFDRRLLSHFDWYLLGLVLLLGLIGVFAIHSASRGYADETPYALRQLLWIGLGLGAGFFVLLVDFRTIGSWSYVLHGLVVASLVVLAILEPGAGSANRWFVLGPVALQPSEFAKLTSVLAVAFYFRDNRRTATLGFRHILIPLGMVALPAFLIVRQPDLGTALLILICLVPMVVLAGLRWRVFGFMAAAGVLAIVGLVASFQLGTYRIGEDLPGLLSRQRADAELVRQAGEDEDREFSSLSQLRERYFGGNGAGHEEWLNLISEHSFRPYISYVLRPYQQKRLLTFLNPEKDPLGAGYHIIQSKVAIGSGGMWGKGYGNSTQGSLNFLPERHTDFVFAIFAEEWGFLGVMVLLALYGLVISRGVTLVFQTRDRFSACLVMGVISIITAQVLVNIAMVVGLLPVVGVPLPFVSYGGSSMLSLMIGIALIENIRMRRFLWT
jgi:rod shape determining protein RodA